MKLKFKKATKQYFIYAIFTIGISLLTILDLSAEQEKPFISTTHDTKQPAVAAEGRNIYLVWLDNRKKDPLVYFRRSPDEGITWGEGICLSSTGTPFCYPPAITVNNGVIHVVWIDYGENIDGEFCHVRSSDSGRSWSNQEILLRDANSSRFPLLIKEQSNLYLVWQDVQNNLYFKSSYNNGVNWEKEKNLIKLQVHSCYCYPPAFVTDAGRLFLIYPKLVEERKLVSINYMSSSDAGRIWGDEKFIMKVSEKEEEDGEVPYPVSASNGSSLFYLFWIDKRNFTLGELFFTKSSDGGKSWDKEKRFFKERSSPKRPSLFLDESNSLHIVWTSFLGGKSKVYYTRLADSKPDCEKPVILAEPQTRYHDPVIAMTETGALHVFWFDESDNWSRIFYKRSTDNGVTWQTWKF